MFRVSRVLAKEYLVGYHLQHLGEGSQSRAHSMHKHCESWTKRLSLHQTYLSKSAKEGAFAGHLSSGRGAQYSLGLDTPATVTGTTDE